MSNPATSHRGTQPNILQSEPVITSAVVSAVTAIIGLAIAFGAPITEGQADAVQTAIPPIMVIIFLITRMFVTPKAAVTEQTKKLPTGKKVVVAGEANELVKTGKIIRDVGSSIPKTDAEG